MNKSIIF